MRLDPAAIAAEHKILDAHGHIGALASHCTPMDASADGVIRMMDLLGVTLCCVSPIISIAVRDYDAGYELLQDAFRRYSGRFLGLLPVHPRMSEQGIKWIEQRLANESIIGIKVHPYLCSTPTNDPRWEAAMSLANEAGCVVFAHSDGGPSGDAVSAPRNLRQVITRFPNAMFVLAHAGFSRLGYEQAFDLVREFPNVYLELSPLTGYSGLWIEDIAQAAGIDRILYGSDTPILEPRLTLGRILHSSLSDREKDQILRVNLAALLSRLGRQVS